MLRATQPRALAKQPVSTLTEPTLEVKELAGLKSWHERFLLIATYVNSSLSKVLNFYENVPLTFSAIKWDASLKIIDALFSRHARPFPKC